MKRIFCAFMLAALLFSLAACSANGDKTKTAANAANSAAAADNAAAPANATEKNVSAAPSADGIDVDLTAMSPTMVYSEVLNMQQNPDDYRGKIVKMNGPFNVTELDGNRYFACVIADATACCTTGIEFDWAGDHSYPEDYPKVNEEITVVGTFTTYKEGNSQYLQLKDAELEY